MATSLDVEAAELGIRRPALEVVDRLATGEVGYLITGVKEIDLIRVGDTVTHTATPTDQALPGYLEPKPMVFSGLFPTDGDEFERLREALDKLRLNDSSLVFQAETSRALGFGFRVGFLGLLHMEIVRERLEREYDLDLVATAPSVAYVANLASGEQVAVRSPQDLPDVGSLVSIEEPYVKVMIITPSEYIGTVMDLVQQRRGEMGEMTYLSPERAELHYRIPLAEIVFDFFDQLKTRTRGYASLDYEPDNYQVSDLVRVNILLNGIPVDAFSTIVHRDKAYPYGKAMVGRLRELIPRQLFDVPDSGGDRHTDHLQRDDQGTTQGRHREMLRRRHHPQAQAPRASEGRQTPHEDGRPSRGAARSVRSRPEAGNVRELRATGLRSEARVRQRSRP